MQLNEGCLNTTGKILHETLHGNMISLLLFKLHFNVLFISLLIALGFVHMHNVPNREQYVKILFNNIKYREEGRFSSHDPHILSQQYFPYDYNSIMHYSAYAYSKNKHRTIIIPNVTTNIGCLKLKKKIFFSI